MADSMTKSGLAPNASLRDYLAAALPAREQIDRFLDPDCPKWARFDPELGWVMASSVVRDGVDHAYTVNRFEPGGYRRHINYADRPCRINAYGDSFTQCHQVSDGETWEEILAAHLGEPVRNFGVGGYGVYTAYRRMLREQGAAPASHVIFNVWFDDHFRNLYPWLWLRFAPMLGWRYPADETDTQMGLCNPWSYARLHEQTGEYTEYPNTHPTPESLYRLCDLDDVETTFADDLAVQLSYALTTGRVIDATRLRTLADVLDADPDDLHGLQTAWGLQTSRVIIDRAAQWCAARGTRLLVLLSYGSGEVLRACEGRARGDQPFLDHLRDRGLAFVDTLQAHLDDFGQFSISPLNYVRRYYNGHYNPAGNHFFAFAIKDVVAGWLDPAPLAYLGRNPDQDERAAALQ